MAERGELLQRELNWRDRKLVLRIGPPGPEPSGDWSCLAEIEVVPPLEGIAGHRHQVFGIDSWQCVDLAFAELQHVARERFPDAYLFQPGDLMGFEIRISAMGVNELDLRLRNHLEREADQVREMLWEEAVGDKRRRWEARQQVRENDQTGENPPIS